MNKLKQTMALVTCGMGALAIAPSAMATAEPGFYIGLSGGQSSYGLEKSEFDLDTRSAFISQNTSVVSGGSSFDDSDTALALLAGYRLSPYIAVEASYLDLGSAEYNFSGVVSRGIIFSPQPATVKLNVKTKAVTLAGIGSLPIGNVFDLHARLGLLAARAEASATVTVGNSVGRDKDTSNSVTALYGAGAGFHFGRHWSLSADWTRYVNVGDDDNDDIKDGFDIDAVTATVSYKF